MRFISVFCVNWLCKHSKQKIAKIFVKGQNALQSNNAESQR